MARPILYASAAEVEKMALATAPAAVARQLQRPVAWVYKAGFRALKRLREEVETLAVDVPVRPK